MCIAGARWVQEHILESNPEAKIKVYTVWFNVLARDRRSSWSEEHFGDDRVVEFWDGDRLFSPWYRDHLPGHSKTIAWDLYALCGPEARWEKAPSHLVNWGRTVYSERKQLAAEVGDLLNKR